MFVESRVHCVYNGVGRRRHLCWEVPSPLQYISQGQCRMKPGREAGKIDSLSLSLCSQILRLVDGDMTLADANRLGLIQSATILRTSMWCTIITTRPPASWSTLVRLIPSRPAGVCLSLAVQSDDVIWQVVNYQFCSFKSKIAEEQTFCRYSSSRRVVTNSRR